MFLESLQWKLILALSAPTDLLENGFRLGYLQNIILVVDSRDLETIISTCNFLFIFLSLEPLTRLKTSRLYLISAQSIKYYLVLKYLQL